MSLHGAPYQCKLSPRPSAGWPRSAWPLEIRPCCADTNQILVFCLHKRENKRMKRRHNNALVSIAANSMHNTEILVAHIYWWRSAEWWCAVTHHACRAQMGSISVMHTMAPRALRAVQQPFPTYRSQGSAIKRSAAPVEIQSFQVKAFVLCFFFFYLGMTHLSITTHNHLFASKHYVRGPFQAIRER